MRINFAATDLDMLFVKYPRDLVPWLRSYFCPYRRERHIILHWFGWQLHWIIK